MECVKRLLAAFLLAVLFSSPAAAKDKRVSEVHPLGVADPQSAYSIVRDLVSGEGRAVLDEGHNSIIVLDVPQRQKAVRKVLKTLQLPVYSVRIDARIVDHETGREAELSSGGQLILSLPAATAEGAVYFDVDKRRSAATRSASQFIVVSSGGSAAISVGREVPFLGWITTYGKKRGVIVKDIEWKKIGSRLSVTPVVTGEGRTVRLRVVPALDYLVGKRRKQVAFTEAATELTVRDGEEVRIGGTSNTEEFYSRFFAGYDRQRRVRAVDVYLKATILSGPGGKIP